MTNNATRNNAILRVGTLVLMSASASAYAQTTTTLTREFYPTTGLLKSETRDGVTTSFTYNAAGNIETITKPGNVGGNKVYRFTNYMRGVPQREDHPEGVFILREVNDLGFAISETDGEGNKTVYERDAFGRTTAITRPRLETAVTRITFRPADPSVPASYTLRQGNYVEVGILDGFGRLIDKTVGGVVETTYQYDPQGRKTFESYPFAPGSTPTGTHFNSDPLGRPLSVQHADNSSVGYIYRSSADGTPQTDIKDEVGNIVTHSFRGFGEPDKLELMRIDPAASVASAAVALRRNVRGQITEASQGGFVRKYGYDSRYYLTSVWNPETDTTLIGRDDAGNMVSLKVGGSGTTYFDIDGLDRAWRVRYPDSSKNVTQYWYKNGLPKQAINGSTMRSWLYDADKNLQQESLAVGALTFDITYEHDANDYLSTIQYPMGGNKLFLYPDTLGRPSMLGAFVRQVDYHPTGMVKIMTFGNGVVSAYQPDARMRPATLAVGKGGGGAYVNLALGYDEASNLKSVSDTANPNNNRSFGYDAIARLTSVNNSIIAYDGAGNIRQQDFGGTLTYSYDPTSNRLTGTSGTKAGSYAYDVRGNITSNGAINFQYDDNSRLRCAYCGTGSEILYDYDALGMRVSRSKGGKIVYQVTNHAGDLLMEFEPATNKRQEHIYFGGKRVASTDRNVFQSSSVTVRASTSNVKIGETVTLTAQVSGSLPRGDVNFYDRGQFIGSGTLVNGVATLTTESLGYGFHSFSAQYAGDGINLASTTVATAMVDSGNFKAVLVPILNMLLED
jgi:YD repeat-containing protein